MATSRSNASLEGAQRDGMEWLNSLVESIWPELATYLETEIFYNTLEPLLQQMLKEIRFERVNLGATPFKLTKPTLASAHEDEITLAFDVVYDGSDADIMLKHGSFFVGLKDIEFRARLGLTFSPLISQSPMFGSVAVFFIDVPQVSMDLTGILKFASIPTLRKEIIKLIENQIAAFMCLPNRLVIPIADESLVDRETILKIQCTPPIGVLRLNIKRAANLRNADSGTLVGGKSDPYCSTRLELHKWHTKKIKNSLNPEWNETHNFVVSSLEQTITVRVRDDDIGNNDDLGSCSFKVSEILERSLQGEVTFQLSGKGAVQQKQTGLRGKLPGLHSKSKPQPSIVLSADWLEKDFKPNNSESKEDVVQILFLSMVKKPSLQPTKYPPPKMMDQTSNESNHTTNVSKTLYEIKVNTNDGFSHVIWVTPIGKPLEYAGDIKHIEEEIMQGVNFTVPNTIATVVNIEMIEHPTGAKSDLSHTVGKIVLTDCTYGSHDFPNVRSADGTLELSLRMSRWGLHRAHELPNHNLSIARAQIGASLSTSQASAVSWINGYLSYVWPHLSSIVQTILKESIEPAIADSLPESMKSHLRIIFHKLLLGEQPLRLENFQVIPGMMNEVDLQADVVFESTTSDVEILVKLGNHNQAEGAGWANILNPKRWVGWLSSAVGGRSDQDSEGNKDNSMLTLGAGLEDLQFRGRIGLGIRPLLTSGSLIGAISLYFIDKPYVDMDLTGAANLMDAPLVRGTVRSAIQQVISDLMVLPNRMVIPFVEESDMLSMDLLTIQNPRKEGVLKLKVNCARNVRCADLLNSKSDPYCIVTLGSRSSRTHTVDNTMNPDWSKKSVSESFVVSDMQQLVVIQVFDEDRMGFDDLLGTIECTVQELVDITRGDHVHWSDPLRYAKLVAAQSGVSDADATRPPSSQTVTRQGNLTLILDDPEAIASGHVGRTEIDVQVAWLIKDFSMPTTPRSPSTTGLTKNVSSVSATSVRKLSRSQLPSAGGLVEILVTSIREIFMDTVDTMSQLDVTPGEETERPQMIEPCYLFVRIRLKRQSGRPSSKDVHLSQPLWLDETVASQGKVDVNRCFMFVLGSVPGASEPDSLVFELVSSRTGKIKSDPVLGDTVQDINYVSTTQPLRFKSDILDNTESDDKTLEFDTGETLDMKIRTTRLVLDSNAAQQAYKKAMEQAAATERVMRQNQFKKEYRIGGDPSPSIGTDSSEKTDRVRGGTWLSWLCSGCSGVGWFSGSDETPNPESSSVGENGPAEPLPGSARARVGSLRVDTQKV